MYALGAFRHCHIPRGARRLFGHIVLKVKECSMTGRIEKFKARFVLNGAREIKGIDYSEANTYAPVCSTTLIFSLASYASFHKLEIYSIDFAQAYINSDTNRTQYVSRPTWYPLPQHLDPNIYDGLQVLCGWYGDKEAAFLFAKLEHESFLACGFVQSKSDPCLYVYKGADGIICLVCYSDDCMVVPTSKSLLDQKVHELSRYIKIREYKLIDTFVGMKIKKNNNHTYTFTQEAYIDAMAEQFNVKHMERRKVKVPCPPVSYDIDELKASSDSEREKVKSLHTRNLLGAISFAATRTRPDVAHACFTVARASCDLGIKSYKVLIKILQYLLHTKHDGITIGSGNNIFPSVQVFCDASFASCIRTRKSTTGYVIMFNNSPLIAKTNIQRTVAASSTEAEVNSAVAALKRMKYIVNILMDLGFKVSSQCLIDNSAAVKMLNGGGMKASRHFMIRVKFAQEMVKRGEVEIVWIDGKQQTSDILTKNTGPILFNKHKSKLLNTAARYETNDDDDVNVNVDNDTQCTS